MMQAGVGPGPEGTGSPQNPQNFFYIYLCWQIRFLVVYKIVFIFSNYNVFTLFFKYRRPILLKKYNLFVAGAQLLKF